MWYQNRFRRHVCDMHIDDWSEDFTIRVKCDIIPRAVYKLPEEKEIPARISGNEISFACEDFGMLPCLKSNKISVSDF